MKPWLIPTGGFLGAGKTTLILTAARLLRERGLRAAAVMNDQGDNLVDTRLLRASDFAAGEVTGGCFCCRFSDLVARAEELLAFEPAAIFIEPVGSCTDLSATILQPLKSEYRDRFRIAPLTVVVDPHRARALSAADAEANMRFLFEKQIAEADMTVVNWREPGSGGLPLAGEIRYLNARTGAGVAEWLDEVTSGTVFAGTALLDIDYGEYARAEAALAWLNWHGTVRVHEPLPPAQVLGPVLDRIIDALKSAGASLAHLKALDETVGGYVKAAFTALDAEPVVDGDLTAAPAQTHDLFINARVVMEPAELAALVRAAVNTLAGDVQEHTLQCFRPGEPRPQRRMRHVVA